MLGEIIDQSVKESKVDLFISLTIEKLKKSLLIFLLTIPAFHYIVMII